MNKNAQTLPASSSGRKRFSTPKVIATGSTTATMFHRVRAKCLADAGQRVTLLEAGARDENPAIHDLSRKGELWHSADD